MATKRFVLVLVLLAAAGVPSARGAEPERVLLPAVLQPGWGTSDDIAYARSAWDFQPIALDQVWTTNEQLYRFPDDDPNIYLIAGLNLPDGARVTRLEVEACDETNLASVQFSSMDCPAGSEADCTTLTLSTGGSAAPGCAIFGGDTLGFSFVIDNATRSYHLTLLAGSADGMTRVRGVRVRYLLQVSPAPAVATFNDVPTNHPFFQFVEALAASGITAGCGGGNYCPDNPLTRGQMAVFLANALGLHWD